LEARAHHGNGVQHAFADYPNVLYISLHVYKDGNFHLSQKDGISTFAAGDAVLYFITDGMEREIREE
jgi:acetoin utilization deacetylase AcuC-like enzyme